MLQTTVPLILVLSKPWRQLTKIIRSYVRRTVEQREIQRDDLAEVVQYIPGAGLVSPQVQELVSGYQSAEIAWDAAKKAEKSTRENITLQVVSTYASAIRARNELDVARVTLEDTKQQLRTLSLAEAVGLLADFDYEKAKTQSLQIQEQCNYLQSQYEGAISGLRSLLGKGEDWVPVLTSRPELNEYEREDLSLELSRGLSRSVQVWSKEAELNIEKGREKWIIPGISSEMQSINTGIKEADYEQARRDTKAQIEQLYFVLESLEGQIAAAQKACDISEKNLELGELKYKMGLIPNISMTAGGESVSSYRISAEKASITLQSLKATLAETKAKFAFLTGKQIYQESDWRCE